MFLLNYSIKVQHFNIKQTCFVCFNGPAHVIWDSYRIVIKTQILMFRRSIPSGQSRQSLQCLHTQKTMTVLYKHSLGNVRKQAKIKNQYNQVLHLTQDTAWESDKKTTRKHHIQESHEASPFPTDDHKPARNRHGIMAKTNTNNQKAPQKKHRLGMVSKSVRKITGVLFVVKAYTCYVCSNSRSDLMELAKEIRRSNDHTSTFVKFDHML